jgi:hypothetical protein
VANGLRASSTALAFLGMLGVAAAVSVKGEREQDTWVSLLTTLLTPAASVWSHWKSRRSTCSSQGLDCREALIRSILMIWPQIRRLCLSSASLCSQS